MAKNGGFIKGLMKVIFALIALVVGAVAIFTMFAPGLTGTKNAGETMIYTVDISCFALAFGGNSVSTITLNVLGNSTTNTFESAVDLQVGVLIAFIVLAVAVFLALVYIIFAWGNKAAGLKKAFGIASFLCFIAAGVLFFCTKPMCPSLTSIDINGQVIDFSDSISLRFGAILTGVFSIIAGISIAIASMFSPAKN